MKQACKIRHSIQHNGYFRLVHSPDGPKTLAHLYFGVQAKVSLRKVIFRVALTSDSRIRQNSSDVSDFVFFLSVHLTHLVQCECD